MRLPVGPAGGQARHRLSHVEALVKLQYQVPAHGGERDRARIGPLFVRCVGVTPCSRVAILHEEHDAGRALRRRGIPGRVERLAAGGRVVPHRHPGRALVGRGSLYLEGLCRADAVQRGARQAVACRRDEVRPEHIDRGRIRRDRNALPGGVCARRPRNSDRSSCENSGHEE